MTLSVGFVEALLVGDVESVRAAPKADLHSHSYFGTRIRNVERWLGRDLEHPPTEMAGLQGMKEYAAKAIDPYMLNRGAFEFVADSAVRDAIEDGVVLFEMSFDIRAVGHYEDGLDGLIPFVESLSERFPPDRTKTGTRDF